MQRLRKGMLVGILNCDSGDFMDMAQGRADECCGPLCVAAIINASIATSKEMCPGSLRVAHLTHVVLLDC